MNERREAEIAVMAGVAAFFGFPAFGEIVPVGFGLANHNYFLHTSNGEYVVRFLVNQAPELVENDVAIQQQLHRAGVQTPHYLRNADGAYLYQRDHRYAVVSPKIAGVTPRHMSVELAADIGRHLALFHTSVHSLPRSTTQGLLNPAVATVESAAARQLPAQELPAGVIHGDFHSGNVLVDPASPDRVVAVLDFEEAGANLYLIDLAVTLMAVGAAPDSDVIVPEFFRAVREGYESVRRLTGEEITWLPLAIRYASEAWVNWFRANGYEKYARQHWRRYLSFYARNP